MKRNSFKILGMGLAAVLAVGVSIGAPVAGNKTQGAIQSPVKAGLTTKPQPGPKGLVGFDATHHHIFISHAQGSDIVNIHLYGWGSMWPFPEGNTTNDKEPDDGTSIDEVIQRAVRDHQQVMLTCATAASIYRASGKPWNMEERVMPSMEDQYAQRCAAAVKRWPQIGRVQVWNELKGYWDNAKNRWDYEGYTRFYNKVYTAVKAVRPSVKVGGGYVVMAPLGYGFDQSYGGVSVDSRNMDAMLYWLKHAKAYDAVCLDGEQTPQNFVKLTHYFRHLAPGKPIWWSEFYGKTLQEMQASQEAIANDQQPGDVALWWASREFPWGRHVR